jgi:uncharacterized peroxidase-related enzyme
MERGHTPEQKQAFARVEADSGVATPDAVLSLTYRCEFFGTPYSDLLHEVMRGPSDWSVGDRELFAAFVSSENQCPYWTANHGAVASSAYGNEEVLAKVLEDWRTAPIDGRTRASLGFLQKLTESPGDVSSLDVTAMRDAGVRREAIVDVIYIGMIFNLIDRFADAFGLQIPEEGQLAERAQLRIESGYRL